MRFIPAFAAANAQKYLTVGSYRGFRKRHLELADRVAQKMSRARDSVVNDLWRLFPTLAKLVIEHKLQPSQIFNRDETSFESRSNTRIVVAIRGSSNVHTNIPETSFHHLFVASVAACGFAVPPLFIVPGMRVPRKILNECTV